VGLGGGRGGRGVSSLQKGGSGGHLFAATKLPPSPGSGAARHRGEARHEQLDLFFLHRFSPLLMRRWAGLNCVSFLILLASHNNRKQLGLLIFLSSKVRWTNDFFIATKKV
jgi:hypothetical protein